MKFQITKACPAKIVFQSLPSGDYDYSEFQSADAAWESEKDEAWVQAHIENGGTIEGARAEFVATLTEATQDEALQAASNGYTWPQGLGFVEAIEGDD